MAKITAVLAVASTLIVGPAAAAVTRPTHPALSASAAAGTTYDTTVLADSPLFYWPLDEKSGAVRDLTGRAAASTVTNAQLGVAGASGTAVSFDGGSQRIEVPFTSSMRQSGSFTAEVWAKLPSTPQTSGWPTVFSRGNVNSGHFGSAMWVSSDSRHAVHFKRNGYDVGTSRGLLTTGYRHLAFTWDNAAKRWSWYVDGTLDTTGVLTGMSGVDTESAPLEIGAMLVAAGSSPVNFGRLHADGLALYNKVLSATRVAAHYTAGSMTAPQRYAGGVAVGGLQPWNSRRAADYQAMGTAKMSWLRSDLGWMYLQPTAGTWRWDVFDPVVADAQAAGMRYLAILHTVPGWANGNAGDYGPPANLALLTDYCYQTAKHYLPRGVTHYQVGNEVNLPHPGWSPSGAEYAAKYLVPCTAGVRQAASEVGVPATILMGSMAPTDWTGGANPTTFLADVYANGGAGRFDAVSWHPYTGEYTPYASAHMNSDPVQLNEIMAARGDGAKKIWATEYGVPTGGPYSVSEQVQANYVGSALDVWYSHPFAGPLFWYSGRDTGTATDDREQHFGLLRYDGTAKPAYAEVGARLVR